MPTKSKSAPRAKAKPKRASSQIKKKSAPPKKSAAKGSHLKLVKPVSPPKAQPKPKPKAQLQPQKKHPFWKLLEAKEQQRKQHNDGQPLGDRTVQKQIEYRHQAKYARFAGPRRRAA
ncbi:MAG: hypothetical protein V4760_10975 [Bdellovibrionota bacterium]